jgi:hypothetical protein
MRGTVQQKENYSELTMRIENYLVTRKLETKGTATLYEGHSEPNHRAVMLKVFTPPAPKNEKDLDVQWQQGERWLHILDTVASLTNRPRVHAHIVRITDVRTFAETPLGKCHYAVMEPLSGESLADRLAQSDTLELGELADYTLQIASALDALHTVGIAHGSICARKCLFERPGSPILKMIGFGMTSCLVAEEPSAPARDRLALALLIKEAISEQGLNGELPRETKKVLLHAIDPQQGYESAMEFAREFKKTIPTETHNKPTTRKPQPQPKERELTASEGKKKKSLLRGSFAVSLLRIFN